MKNNHKFTLVNFQDHSCGLLYGDSTTNWMWSFWQNMYVADLAVDGQIIGKAYCALWVGPGGSSDWCDELDHVHGGGDCDSPETNFTLDGTNWYSVWHYYSYGGPTDDECLTTSAPPATPCPPTGRLRSHGGAAFKAKDLP